MDGGNIAFIVAVIIVAGLFIWTMFRSKYIGSWIIHGATGEKLFVYRTSADARNDGKETMQFRLSKEITSEGTTIAGDDCITIVPLRWIIRMDKLPE